MGSDGVREGVIKGDHELDWSHLHAIIWFPNIVYKYVIRVIFHPSHATKISGNLARLSYKSLTPGKGDCHIEYIIFKNNFVISANSLVPEKIMTPVSMAVTDDKWTMWLIMAWRCDKTNRRINRSSNLRRLRPSLGRIKLFVYMMTSSNGTIFRVTGPLCGEFTGPGEFPTQRPVTWSFDVFFDLRLNKRLSEQP